MKKLREVECYGYTVAVPSPRHARSTSIDWGPSPARDTRQAHRGYHLRVAVPGQTWYFRTKDGAMFLLHLRNKG